MKNLTACIGTDYQPTVHCTSLGVSLLFTIKPFHILHFSSHLIFDVPQ